MRVSERGEAELAVVRLRELYPDATTFELARRLRRRAALAEQSDPPLWATLQQRADELERTGQ